MDEICGGCKGSCGVASSFRLTKDGDLKICPCVSCLVKVTCIVGCDDFAKYVEGENND